jgi:cell division protein FtsB
MSYAICRIAKLKTWGNIGGSAAHTYRHEGKAPNADPVRLGRNRTLVGTPDQVVADVRARVDQLAAPRANAVLCVEHLLTASPDFFKGKSPKQVREWADQNIAWLVGRYGSGNVCHAALHMDESTPHIVAYVVPEVAGKLNARALYGGREKLRALQDDYAAAMRSTGLQRGVEGSRARHRTVKNFYASLDRYEAVAIEHLRKLGDPVPPPEASIGSVLNRKRYDAELGAWGKQAKSKMTKTVQVAVQAAVAVQTMEETMKDLKSANSALTAENEALKAQLSALEVGRLRRLDISAVAERLGHMGVVKKGDNAIDLVKKVNGFDFNQAVAWLHAEFGAVEATQAVREHLDVAKPERPLSKAEKTIQRAVHTQLEALGCDQFRISLVPQEGGGAPYLPGKSRDGVERFYTRRDVEHLVPYLRYENNVGRRHVFITPMDNFAYYVLVDDARRQRQDLEADGFAPCLIQKSSWNSSQVVFKIPVEGVERQAVVDVFNSMNREWGDASVTGLRHPFRLAGFRNFKPKHERDGNYPFVEIVLAVNQFCQKTLALVTQRQTKLEFRTPTSPSPTSPARGPRR